MKTKTLLLLFTMCVCLITSANGALEFQQDSGADGIVSMESENFHQNTPQGGHDWLQVTTPSGFSGAAAMQAQPDNGTSYDTGYAANSPRLDFEVDFVKTGTHYVWFRGYAIDGLSDSCHAGLDGQEIATADRIADFGYGTWDWSSTTMDSSRATIEVASTGIHTINVWMREDGFIVDKIVLTTNSGYTPSGAGPAESPRSGDPTPPAAPTGLVATAGNNNISLNWDDNTELDLASYNVYRDTTTGGPYTQIASDVFASNYVDNTVVNGTTYYYVVTAVDTSSNESESSSEISATPYVPIRYMENLGDGVVAVRTGSASVFVSWRLLGLDPAGIGFNLYRSTGGGEAVKLNSSVLTDGTCYADTSADCTQSLEYYVKAVIGGEEQPAGDSYTLPANATVGPYFSVPLQNIGDYYVQHAWVGDFDNDGEYEFVVARRSNTGDTSKLEAYMRNGTFLWRVDMGINSIVDSDLNDGPVASLSNGHNDHATVYDLDSDGVAEVILKTANGVVFGDGTTLEYGDDQTQFISVLNGMTGAEMARATVPNPYAEDGGLGGHFGIGYFDGVHPTFLFKAKNRNADGGFNLVVTTWDFDGSSLNQRWTWSRDRFSAPPNFHQIRILDVDGDGRDELADGGYVLDDNGTMLYNLADSDIVHGDRFHIGDLDPDNPGLEGWGIQQSSPTGILEYYYDAADGSMIWQHTTTPPGGDVGRGMVADVDPRYAGYEGWSFYGIYNLPDNTQITQEPDRPWPNFNIWWDGDTLGERLHETKVDKWDYLNSSNIRLLTGYNYEGATDTWRDAPTFYGDIIGDWREEIIFESNTRTQFHIFTTNIPSGVRLYTLAHNPEYRNCMTVKGYLQSNMLDYYLGDGMSTPPTPGIVYVGGTGFPAAPTGLIATPGDGTVSLDWNDNTEPDLDSYIVYRSTTSGSGYAVIETGVLTSDYVDNTVTNGTKYYYVVTAVDIDTNESVYSNEASATPQAVDTDPPTPNPATFAVAPAADSDTAISMTATTGSDASGPVEYMFTETSGNPGGTSSGWQTSPSYTDSGLDPSTQYTYTVQMRDSAATPNVGSPSAPANATTDPPPPALPWTEDFESGSFTAGGWTTTGTPTVSNKVEYSGIYGAKIPKTASIEKAVSTAGFTNIHVKYRRETKGLDTGENLIVEWYDGSNWNPLETVQNADYSDGLQDKTCGTAADNNVNFRVKFRTNAGSANEYASLDDIEVTGTGI